MVDFRYHLVSIIAVFLALAVGIVVGTAALNGPVLDRLRSSIDDLSADKRSLQADVRDAEQQIGASDEFAALVGPEVLGDALADERVLLVTTPATPDGLAEQLRPVLEQAGASVTGELEVLPALADPQNRAVVQDLVAEVLPAGVDLPSGEAVPQAAALLAAALTTDGDSGVDAADGQAVVSAFGEADLAAFTGEGDTLRSATLAVVLTGPAPEQDLNEAEEQQVEALLAVAAALDERSRGAVLAGASRSAEERGTVRALRENGTVSSQVSGVDNVDRGVGRVAVVRALAEQLDGGVGQYGAGPGSTGPLPAGG
jgi:hypothetical protein